jgi:hypothetical protein
MRRLEPFYPSSSGPWSLIRVIFEPVSGSGFSTQALKRPKKRQPSTLVCMKEIYPRGNNKVVIIYIFMFMINVYISC